jgi:AcrR family transcriptional regulator
MSRANYHSPRREQAAQATRQAILDAAQELFASHGYSRTTVTQIAKAAHVATNTVYTSVGGKPQLLAAITADGTNDPAVADTLAAVTSTTDPAEVIRLTAAGTRLVTERHSKGITVLLDSAQSDQNAAEMLRLALRRHRDTLTTIAQRLQELGALAPSDQDRAADIFWYLFGLTSWRTLTADLGWTFDQAEHWLTQRGIEALLTRTNRKPKARSVTPQAVSRTTHQLN